MYSVKKIVQIIKSLTAREIFRRHPEVKRELWGGIDTPSACCGVVLHLSSKPKS